jgi:hypothetical protein
MIVFNLSRGELRCVIVEPASLCRFTTIELVRLNTVIGLVSDSIQINRLTATTASLYWRRMIWQLASRGLPIYFQETL